MDNKTQAKDRNKPKKVVIKREDGFEFHYMREETDPIAMRASIGGEGKGFYCVIRGDDLDAIESMLQEVVTGFGFAKEKLKDA